jgi:hypothetical protein
MPCRRAVGEGLAVVRLLLLVQRLLVRHQL